MLCIFSYTLYLYYLNIIQGTEHSLEEIRLHFKQSVKFYILEEATRFENAIFSLCFNLASKM